VSPDDLQSLTLSALLSKLMLTSDDESKEKLGRILKAAKSFGIDQLTFANAEEPKEE
jgi:hypothetical protein